MGNSLLRVGWAAYFWLSVYCLVTETTLWVRLTSPPHALSHSCGLRLLLTWEDLLSFEDGLHLHVISNVTHTMAHQVPFLQSNVSRALVSCVFHNKYWMRQRVLSSFLDSLFSEFPLNLHEGPPFAFQSNKGLYQAYSSYLAGLSSSQTAQHSLSVVRFTQFPTKTHRKKDTEILNCLLFPFEMHLFPLSHN